MDIDVLLRDLGEIDITPLRDAILAQEEAAWRENQHRQEAFPQHQMTESIVLVFCDGWPEVEIKKEAGWDRLSEQAVPVMHEIIQRAYPAGGTILRAMAAKLNAGGRISPHSDTHHTFHRSHRIHVPITTNHRVRFMIDGKPHQLEVGRAYEINNQKQHSVMNKGKEDRITFIFDYAPPERIAGRDTQ